MMSRSAICNFLILSLAVSAHAAEPIVNLNYGRFQGRTTSNVVEFLGMPFAAPPVGNLRFAAPENPLPFDGVRQATSYGASCPYIVPQDNGLPRPPNGGIGGPGQPSEDCLFINVIRPADIPDGTGLPVVFWIYGGAFLIGDVSQYPYGPNVVARSIALNEPVVFVAANYRRNAFGFLGGQEAKDARVTNASLKDQRFALEWTQKYIRQFGGDPRKLYLKTNSWGESAGALSISLHYVLNDGNPAGLFRGGFMQSGSPVVLPEASRYQPQFDQLVKETNCTASTDKIACLRAAPYDSLVKAITTVLGLFAYQSLELKFQAVIDDYFIVRDPLFSLQQGKYATVPLVTGNCEDEGTVVALSTLNLTTSDQFLDFIHTSFFERADLASIAALADAYPDDVTQGSPFNTGTANALSPQFKRFAAIQGDIVFQAPRRFFSEIASKTQPVFGFRFMRGGALPFGYFHGSDISEFFGIANNTNFVGTDALIYFTNHLNPNAPPGSISTLRNFTWPLWNAKNSSRSLFTFVDGATGITITQDTYCREPMELLNKLTLAEVGNGI